MLVRLFRSKSPLFLFFIALATLLLWWSSFASPELSRFHFHEAQMPLYELTMNWIGSNTLVNILVSFLILLLQGLLVLRFNREYIFITTQTYLHPLFYLLIVSSFVQLQQFHPGLPASLFIFLMLDQLFGSYRKRYILNRLFLAGLFVGVATLFYVHAVFFFLLIWVALFILRAFSLREWFVPIIGFAFPMAFLFGYSFVSDQATVPGLIGKIESVFYQDRTVTYYSLSYFLFYGFLIVWWLIGSFSLIRKLPKQKIYTRKYLEILWWLFVGTIALFVLKTEISVEMLYITAIPLSFLLADHVHEMRSNTFGNVMLLIFLGLLGYIQYAN